MDTSTMHRIYFGLLPSLIYILDFSFVASQSSAVVSCPSDCVCDSYSVSCYKVTSRFFEYASKLPSTASRLDIFCDSVVDTNGRPIEKPESLSTFPVGIFAHLPDLVDLSVNNCPIKIIGTGVFDNLPKLETVVLKNLLLETIQANAFAKSKIMYSLWIIQAPDYKNQPPGALHGTGLQHLKLIDSALSGLGIKNLISSALTSLKKIDIIGHKGGLSLQNDTFSGAELDDVSLQNSGIASFDFLNFTKFKSGIFSGNPVFSGLLDFSGFAQNSRVKYLDFHSCNLHAIPVGLDRFPALEDLHLSSNKITVLEAACLSNSSKLLRLDFSSNRIHTFSPSLQPLFSSIILQHSSGASIDLGQNPLHCNCEIAWMLKDSLLSRVLPRKLVCTTGQFINTYLSLVDWNQLVCTKPEPPVIATSVYKSYNDSKIDHRTGYEDGFLAVYLPIDTVARIVCTSKSEPAPDLLWITSDGFQMMRSTRNTDKTSQVTSIQVSIQQSGMRKSRLILTCSASNWKYPSMVNTTVVVVNDASPPLSTEPPIIWTKSTNSYVDPELRSKCSVRLSWSVWLVGITTFLLKLN